MTKFLLLTPLQGKHFGISQKSLIEALHQEHCGCITGVDNRGDTVLYATAKSIAVMEAMCTKNEIPGSIIEYTSIYDQIIE